MRNTFRHLVVCRRSGVAMAGALFLALSTTAFAQSASLLGSVLLDGKETPLPNAEILIPSLKLSTRSDSAGKFALAGIAPGIQ